MKKFGAEIPFIRPMKLAGDAVAIGDVFLHAVKKLRRLGYQFDIRDFHDAVLKARCYAIKYFRKTY